MFPLKDDVPSRSVPFITIALIAVNVLVFLYQLSLQAAPDSEGIQSAREFVFEFGLIPCRLTGQCGSAADFPSPVTTVFTSMFLHAGLFHIFGNMLYLCFYLTSGVVAVLAQTLVNPASPVPMIGASGAVSGVLGAYLILFPRAGVLTAIVFGLFIRLVRIPAVIVLGFWVVVQIVNGLISVGAGMLGRGVEDGVAVFAHVGGFAAGIALLFLLRPQRALRL